MSRIQRVGLLLIVGVVSAAGALVLYRFDPRAYELYPKCLFHALTGLVCAGCGSTRALHALLHGQVRQALAWNALTVISLPVIGVWAADRAWRWIVDRPPAGGPIPPWTVWGLGGVLVAFWVLRNLPLFAFLAPHPL